MSRPGTASARSASAASAAPALSVRTVEIDDVDDLLALLPGRDSLAWVTGGDAEQQGLVGWGCALRLEVSGAERFSRAQRWWGEHAASLDLGGDPDAPRPHAFASFAFDTDSSARSVLIVPEVSLRREGARTWLSVASTERDHTLRLLDRTRRGLRATNRLAAVPTAVTYGEGALSVPQWEHAVAAAVRRIDAGELDKVVLARDIIATSDGPIDPRHVLSRLSRSYPSCATYAVDGLIGSTPELLVTRTGKSVTSRVLAGTVRRSSDSSRDASLASALLASGKDHAEHQYAVTSVAAALAAHCTDLDVPETPRLLALANVQHLATDVTGVLADSSTVLALGASLHPTAAVCGTPQERALAVIRELEGMDRDRYAGPVGWVDADGDGELGIALRCGLIDGDSIRLFAGCGLVSGSEPESELAESQAKLVAMRDALEPA